MKYDLKQLIEKYNKILSDKYNCNYNLIKESIRDSIDAIESIQYNCWSDTCDTYLECNYIKKYLYFIYIKNDIPNFICMEYSF